MTDGSAMMPNVVSPFTVARNPNQGLYKRVLCVCSGGILRSPTAAWVLGNDPYNFNTRSAGAHDEYALTIVDEPIVAWADEIVCMMPEHAIDLRERFKARQLPPFRTLYIPDEYRYRNPELVKLIKSAYEATDEQNKARYDVELQAWLDRELEFKRRTEMARIDEEVLPW